MMAGLVDDLRHGLRALRRAPAFCALVLVTLALGIGGTSAMFSVVYGVLFRPLPFAAPEQLVRVWHTAAGSSERGSFSPAVFLDFQREARSVQGVAGYIRTASAVATTGEPVRIEGAEVTANFFSVLGADAAVGRVFAPGQEDDGASLAVLSDGFWRRHFGGDPGVLGRTVRIDGQSYAVVGVMPPSFAFPALAQLWRLAPRAVPTPPLHVEGDLLSNREVGYMDVVARLTAGVAPSEAAGELRVLATTLSARHADDAGRGFAIEPVYETIVGDVRQSLLFLFAAMGAVLLIACSNIASLMLARALGRRRELAVRTALGAPRGRLVRQLLVETVVLSIIGGGLGVLFAAWALDGLRALLPASLPRAADIQLDLVAVGFAAATSIAVGLAFGTAPAWMSSALASFDALRDGGRASTGGRQWMRRGLVVGQVALAAVLLTAAGVLGASVVKLQRVDVGFKAAGVVTQQLVLPQSRYDEAAQRHFFASLTDRLRTDPRVAAAAVVFPSPFVSSQASATIRLDRPLPGDDANREHTVRLGSITSQFFAAMGTPFVAGRDFIATDLAEDATSIIVSRGFAERLLGGGDVIGRRLHFGDGPDEWYTVVGVVGDARSARLDAAAEPIAYLPYTHFTIPFMRLVVRGTSGDAATHAAILSAVRAEAPDLALDPPETLVALVNGSTADQRVRSWLVAAFAATALGLAVLGLYSLVSYTVTGRTREIATRLALGATPASMRTGVIREGLGLTAVGLVAGLAIAAGLGRLIEGLLYDTAPVDPYVVAGLIAVMLGAALVACYLPARRAMRVDPVATLRAE